MSKKEKGPTQKTLKEGHEIPIPKRSDFLKNLKKVANVSAGNNPKK